jgi:hypothetical protein
MKQTILLFLLFAFASVAFAQPTNSRLDADLKRLTRRFENVESIKRLPVDKNTEIRLERAIQSAENELGRFREKYPDHDLSKFEKALADFKNPQAKSSSTNNSGGNATSADISDFAKVENFVETIEEILDFNPPRFIGGNEGVVDEAKQQIEDFREKMDNTLTPEFLALAKDTSNRKIKRIGEKANREAKAIVNRLASVKADEILAETEQNTMLGKYFQVAFMLEKVKLLNKIFENDANIMSANEVADKLIAQLGSSEDVEKKGKANYAAKVANNRMYPESQNNQALRDQAIRAFNSSVYRANEKGNKVLKVHLVSSGWSVERNEITGIILSRDQQVQIAYKASDGKCYLYLMLFQQKHLGGGKYGGGLDRSGSTSEILCENVPK